MPSWCTQGKIDVYPEVYKSSENKLALLILIDEHPTGKYYILGETYHPPPTHTPFTLLAILYHLQPNFACRNVTQLMILSSFKNVRGMSDLSYRSLMSSYRTCVGPSLLQMRFK